MAGTGTKNLSPEEIALLRSEGQLNLAKIQEIANSGRRDDVKLQMMERTAQQEVASRQKIAETEAGSRRDVANIDVGSRNRTTNLDLATKLLDQIRLAKDSDKKSQVDFLSDISRMPGMKPEDVASTAAEMGNPAMLNALNKSKANLVDNQLRTMIPGYVKASAADKLKQEAQANLLDPNAGKRLSALAYPATAGGPAPELSLRQPTVSAPIPTTNAPVPADVSTKDIVNNLMKVATGTDVGGAGGVTTAAGRPSGPPVGPEGTSHLAAILQARAAGQPYVEGGMVYNQPAGTAGMDLNTNTGEWIPSSREGTIDGKPASQAIADSFTRSMLSGGHPPIPVYSNLAMQRLGLTMPETTTGRPMTPDLVPAPSGGVQASVRPAAPTITPPINMLDEFARRYAPAAVPSANPTINPQYGGGEAVQRQSAADEAARRAQEEIERQRRLALLAQTQR